jgi:uncharacterized membrane protein
MSTVAEKNAAGYGLSTGRLEALSDGVLAIVITLLILVFVDADKEVSGTPNMSNAEVMNFLFGLWAHLLGYVLSFVLIAIYWILHHHMFHYIHRADRGLLWLNLFFLMSVAFLPFPTGLLSECILHESNVIVILYGATHLVCGLALAGVWCYATHKGRLVAGDLDPKIITATMQTTLTGPALYLVGMASSFFNPYAAVVIYCIVPLLYIVPGKIDRIWLMLDNVVESELAHHPRAGGLLAGFRAAKSAKPTT